MDRQRLLLVLTIFISTVILALCWAFIIHLWHKEYVILRDSIVVLIIRYPTELILLSTVISTILSVTTTALFSIAVKHALNHYITKPLSLVELHTAISLTKPQPLLQWNHRRLSLITLVIVGLITLLNSSWTTLLLPTILSQPVSIQGTELDLGSLAFNAQLGLDLSSGNISWNKFVNIINVVTPMSGLSATRSSIAGGNDSVFAFNGVSYSKSSSGIIPAVAEFAGTSLVTDTVGLGYYGGKVAPGILVPVDKYSGLARNYSATQQGVSANITCSPLDSNYSLKIDNSTIYYNDFTIWNGTAYCPLGSGWVTMSFDYDYGGLLEMFVCPDPGTASVTSFDIFLHAEGEYLSTLNSTVCKVAPYMASFDVTYTHGNISISQPLNIQPFQSSGVNVTSFISMMVSELSWSSQTLDSNSLGELLQLETTNAERSVNDVLEDYFRGIVEFSATYLRSAYSAEGANSTLRNLYSDQSAFTSLNGTMSVTTYGWSSKRLTYIYLLAILTIIWAVTVSAAAYSLHQGRSRSRPLFDASNPVHLMMASSEGGFEPSGVKSNADVRVHLQVHDQNIAHGDATGEKSVRASGSKMRIKIDKDTEGGNPK
ncbi:hypothetical protein DEU56DRAFT_940703 [Suillus clintonianus]|uniref:uncharacterized protein n=1 Tax=Suillus clintonianus TaxID=1904413 RepID=UPI001B876875|nr:uncharacterized protein DEU56DRAFT_940703 [Suillus clintonianus]KAG2141260.1 hypothetical protein DEU56DRAFT_940703 [Suillus clintonianus]